MHRLLLMTCFEALESAGVNDASLHSPESLPRIGTYYGCSSDDWRQSNSSQDIDAYFIPGGNRAFGPGRLNYFFDWEGPSYSIDTACSSSATSLQLAMNGLRQGDCDIALTGGSNVATCSDIYAGLSRGGFLSPSGGCKTFLQDADGYCKADAVASLVIKRLEDAEAGHDNILAIIKGCDTNHSAQATFITRPHAATQERLFRKILAQSGVEPHDIDYVEMHGTGTQAGDAMESLAVSNVFQNDPTRTSPLYVGSVKPNIGHSEAASGVASIIKAVLMLKHERIPPHVGVNQPLNPSLPPGFADLITFGPKDFERRGRPRRLLVNNFNATGGNTSMVLEEYRRTPPTPMPDAPFALVTVSGASASSFSQNAAALADYIEAHSQILIRDIMYSTAARRRHFIHRKAFLVDSTQNAIEQLRSWANRAPEPTLQQHNKQIFLFTGQVCHL